MMFYLRASRQRALTMCQLCLIALIATSTTLAHAQSDVAAAQQNAPAPATNSAAPERITLALENADIKELIRWAADSTGKNIILHPDVKGQVTVISGAPLSRDQAYEIFLSTLQAYNFAVIDNNGVLQVVPAEFANQNSAPLGHDKARSNEEIVVQIIKLKNISASQLTTILKPMLPNSALLTAFPDSNLLLVSASAKQIERVRAIIARVDQSGGTEIEMVSLEFARAREVAQIISTLLTKGTTQAPTNFTMTVDERTNSILMTGDAIIRQQIRGLLERLDKPKNGEGNTQVVFVRFASAESLMPILQSVSSSFLKGDKDQATANIDTKIEVSKENNALIITAPPTLQETIKGVIRQLDVRRPQVIVEAIIVEVNDDITNNLGINWNTSVPGDTGTFVGQNTSPDGLSSPTPPGLGSGLTLGFYHAGDLRGLIRALKSNASANLLSTPTIVALDNEQAQILVGSNVPFITGQSTGASSSTTNPFQTIERKDIGITLKVKPRINDDSSITMDVDQTVESIAPSNAKTADIITNKRNVTTRVLIENDQVLVLGGLMQNDATDQQAKIPVLGDMPVVGRLFRSTNTEVVKKNLMVFIHPRILATTEDARTISTERYTHLRSKQQKINEQIDRIFIPESLPTLPDIQKKSSATQPEASAPTAQPPLVNAEHPENTAVQ